MEVSEIPSDAKVNVAVRVRPLIQREKDANESVNWFCDSNMIQQCNPVTQVLNPNSTPYTFDYIFGKETNTKEVYDKVVSPIVENSFRGFNGTVLCYGQTSSGKTHTLYGNDEDPGIISLTAEHLFNRIQDDKNRQYYIRVGLLEVYNEKVTDLLNDGSPIEIKEVKGEVVPKDLTQIEILSADDMLDAAKKVQQKRKIGETKMNKESSRSHTVLRILIESVPHKEDDELPLCNALLNFVDLAGSEKAGQTGAVGERFKEATFINRSLSTLSQVVMQLSGAMNTATSSASSHNISMNSTGPMSTSKQQQPKYVNFRDSKLTRILQSSLKGNAFIAMICNITPVAIDETHSTLRFAKTAKKIKIEPTQNQGPVNSAQYKSKIMELENLLLGKSSEVDRLRQQLVAIQKFQTPGIGSSGAANMIDRRKTCCPGMLSGLRNDSENQLLSSSSSEFDFKSISPNLRRISIGATSDSNFAFKVPEPIDFRRGNNLEKRFPVDTPLKPVTKVDAQTETDFSEYTTSLSSPSPESISEAEASSTKSTSTSNTSQIYPKTPLRIKAVNYLHPSELHEMSMDWREERSFLKHESECHIEDLRSSLEEITTLRNAVSSLQTLCDEYKESALNNEHAVNELNLKIIQQQQETSSDMEELREENNQLSSSNKELTTQLEEKENTIGRLQFENKELVAEATRVKQKLNNFQNQQDLIQENSSLVEELQARIEKQQIEWNEITIKLEAANANISSLNVIIDEYKKSSQEIETANTELKEKLSACHNELSQYGVLKEEIIQLNICCDEYKLAAQNHQQLVNDLTQENDALKTDSASLKASVQNHLDSINKMQETIEKQNADKNDVDHDLRLAVENINSLNLTIDKYKQIIEENTINGEESQTKISELKSELKKYENLQEELKESNKSCDEYKLSSQNLQQVVEELNQEILHLKNMLTDLTNVKDENMKLLANCEELKSILEEKESTMSQWISQKEQQAAADREKEQQAVADREQVNGELEHATQKINLLALQIDELKQTIEDYELQNSSLKTKVSEFQGELNNYENLKEELVQSNKSCDEYKLSAQNHQQVVDELNQEILHLKNITSDLINVKEENMKLLENCEELKSILEEKESTMSQWISEKEQQAAADREQVNGELEDATQKINLLALQIDELKKTIEDHELQNSSLKSKVSELQDELSDYENLKEELVQSNKSCEEYKLSLHNNEKLVSDLKLEILQLEKDSVSGFTELKEENSKLRVDYEALKVSLSQKESTVEELQIEINKEQDNRTTIESKLETAIAKITSLDVVIDEYKKTSEENELINEELRSKISQFENELRLSEEQKSLLLNTCEEYKLSCENSQQLLNEHEVVTNQLQAVTSQLQDLRQENFKLESTCTGLKATIDEKESTIIRMQKDIDQHQENSRKINADIDSLTLVIQEYKQMKEESENQNNVWELKVTDLELLIEDYESEKSKLAKESEEYKVSSQHYEKLVNECKSEIRQLQDTTSELDVLREINVKLNADYNEMKTNLEDNMVLVNNLQQQIKNYQLQQEENLLQQREIPLNEEDSDKFKAAIENNIILTDLVNEYKSSNEEVNKVNNELKLGMSKLENELKQNEAQYMELLQVCENYKSSLRKKERQLDEAKEEIMELKNSPSKNDYLTEENFKLEMTCVELKAALEEKETTLTNVLKKIAEKDSESKDVYIQLKEAKDNINSLNLMMEKYKNESHDYEAVNGELKAKLTVLENELIQYENLKKELTESNKLGEEDKLSAQNQQQVVDELNQEILHLKNMLTDLTNVKEENMKLLTNCEELKSILEEKESTMRQVITEKEQQAEADREKEQQAVADREQVNGELEHATQKINLLALQIDELKKTIEDHELQNSSLKSKVSELQDELSDYENLKEELVQSNKSCDEYKLSTQNYQQAIHELKEEIQHLQESSDKFNDVTEENDRLQADIQVLKSSLAEQLVIVSTMQETSEKQKLEKNEVESALQFATETINSLNVTISQHKEEMEDRNIQCSEFQSRIVELEKELKHYEDLQKELIQSTKACDEYKSLAQNHQQTINELNKEMQNLQESTSKINNLTEENCHLKADIEALKSSLETQSYIVTKMQETLESQQDEKNKVESALQLVTENINSLNLTVNKYKQEIEEKGIRCDGLQAKVTQLEKELKKCESLKEELVESKKSHDECKLLVHSHQQIINELKQEALAYKNAPRVSRRSTDTQTSDSIDPMKYIQQLKMFARKKEQQLKDASEKFEKENAAHLRNVKTLEDQVKRLSDENEKLKASVCYLAEEKEEYRKYKTDKKESAEIEVQCDIIKEIFDRTKRGEDIPLPRGFPDLYKIQKENHELKCKIAPLLEHKKMCICKTPYHTPTAQTVDKVSVNGQSSQRRYQNQNIRPNYAPYQMSALPNLPSKQLSKSSFSSTSTTTTPATITAESVPVYSAPTPPLHTERQNIQAAATSSNHVLAKSTTKRSVLSCDEPVAIKKHGVIEVSSNSTATTTTVKPKLTKSIFDEPPKTGEEWMAEMERILKDYPSQTKS